MPILKTDPSILHRMVVKLLRNGMIERVVGRGLCKKVIGLVVVAGVHLIS